MAKKKTVRKKRSTRKKSSPKKSITMATKKRRRPRRKKTTSVRRRALSAAPTKRRRKRKRGFLSSAGFSKTNLMASIKHNGLGGLGGLLFLGTRAIPIDMPPLVRGIGLGFGGSVLLAMLTKSTHMAAGMAGASVYYLGEKYIAPL